MAAFAEASLDDSKVGEKIFKTKKPDGEPSNNGIGNNDVDLEPPSHAKYRASDSRTEARTSDFLMTNSTRTKKWNLAISPIT
ncbi:hypothetical protein IMY05_011G0066400 [Salix suchowensis]|nr:hypothetical protein IMY05_011G0066400 [Salix suchowensis]